MRPTLPLHTDGGSLLEALENNSAMSRLPPPDLSSVRISATEFGSSARSDCPPPVPARF